MGTLTKKTAGDASVQTYELAEMMALVAKVNFLMRRLKKRHRHDFNSDKEIPAYGFVKIIEPPEALEEVTGEDGIVLSGGKVEGDGYTYTVLIQSRGETYYLPGSALQFTGIVLSEKDIYSGESIRVAVDEATGEGRIIKATS